MTRHTISKIAAYLLVLLAIAVVIGVFAHFTDGFKSDFKTFYISANGKDVMNAAGGYSVTREQTLQIDVKYTFEALGQSGSGYSVKVVPHRVADRDFTYTVGGAVKSFQSEPDLTAGFEITQQASSFTVRPKGDTLTEVLGAVYGQSVSDCEGCEYGDMFTLVVSSYDGEATVQVHFTLTGSVSGVILDSEVIEF